LDKLERSGDDGDTRIVIHRCIEHQDLPPGECLRIHRERGEYAFTLDLGAADVRDGR
jgi:hypothetical protein